jgi:hypothetical protein
MSRTHRALVMLALCLTLAAASTAGAVAAQPTPPTVEDQTAACRGTCRPNRPRGSRPQSSWPDRWNAASSRQYRRQSCGRPADAPAGTAPPSRDVDVLATLLVGLVGGLVGGAAAMAGWTAATRWRVRRVASVA